MLCWRYRLPACPGVSSRAATVAEPDNNEGACLTLDPKWSLLILKHCGWVHHWAGLFVPQSAREDLWCAESDATIAETSRNITVCSIMNKCTSSISRIPKAGTASLWRSENMGFHRAPAPDPAKQLCAQVLTLLFRPSFGDLLPG